jgi:hypothetical protein
LKAYLQTKAEAMLAALPRRPLDDSIEILEKTGTSPVHGDA